MNWVDFAIVGVVALSAIIGVIRGFVRETVSLVVWIAAFWAALHFGPELASAMSGFIETVSVRLVSAFVILFLSVFVIGSLINHFLSKAVKRIGLGGADRVLGVLFGIARGGLVIALVLIVVGLTPLTDSMAWRESLLIGYMSPWLVQWQHWWPGEQVRVDWFKV